MKDELLSDKVLDLYDYREMRNTILEIFELFKYLDGTNHKMIFPRITNDYRVRYEQRVSVKNPVVENFVLKKFLLETQSEEKRIKLFSKIAMAMRKLSKAELEVFHYTFYEQKNDDEILRLVYYGEKKIRHIRKSACIKFLSCLGLDNQCIKRDVSFDNSFSNSR